MRRTSLALFPLLLLPSAISAATYLFNPPASWPNEDPSNVSGTVTVYYDFRTQNGYANSIASSPAELAIVQDVLSDITTVTGGQLVFARDTNPADTDKIINIGVGDLAAVSGGSGGETLGMGGATEYIPGGGSPYLGQGFAWLDSSQTWNTTLGNGNVTNPANSSAIEPDFYSVLFHEMGHALGLGHSTSSTANIMTPVFEGQKQLPAQDDVNGLRFLYPSTPAVTDNYDAITRAYPNGFHVFPGSGGQYNTYTNPATGGTVFSYVADAGTVSVSGITDINHTTPYLNTATFEQQGGNWTDQHIQIAGPASGTYDLSAGTLTCPFIEVFGGGIFNVTGGTLNATYLYTLGTTTLAGTQNWAAGASLTVAGGPTTFNTDAGSASSANLAVLVNSGTVTFNATQHLASLTVDYNSTATVAPNGAHVLVLNSLDVTTTGSAKLDLADNDLLLHSSDVATDYANLQSWLLVGRNDGHAGLWTGNGITSSLASHSGTETHALALAINSQPPNPFNSTTHLFDGQAADSSTLLIKYTYTGDVNLDGIVDSRDYLLMDAAYLNEGVGLGGATGWVAGDFNYDGVVDYRDYALADASLAIEGSPLAVSMIAMHTQEFGAAYAAAEAAAIPEPASLLLPLAGAALLHRRHAAAGSPRAARR